MKASEFGRLRLTNTHLAFGSKGDARSEPGMTDSMLINAGKAKDLSFLSHFKFNASTIL